MAAISEAVSKSPKFRPPASKVLTLPWASIVRGGEPEATPSSAPSSPVVAAVTAVVAPSSPAKERMRESDSKADTSIPVIQTEISSENSSSNVAKAKKQVSVWNRPSNGDAEVSPVMGAVSWPALSESAKAPKSSSDYPKGLTDGSVPVSQVSQGPVIASLPQKQVNVNANANPNPNPRQKSNKRGGGGGGNGSGGSSGSAANGGSHQVQPPPPLPLPVLELQQQNLGKLGGPVVPNSSPRGRGSQANDHTHQQQRNFRRSNSGPHPRRDHDRGNHDWHPPHRSFNGRDMQMQPRGVQRNFMRTPPPPPPPNPVPFVTPPPVRPFGNPIGFPDMASPVYYVPAPPSDSLRGVPIFHAPPFMIVPGVPGAVDPTLRAMIIQQIDYYFSPGNLCKDIFLRNHMDEQGWVPVSLIATFKRVKQLTTSIPLIMDVMRSSSIVEVQGDKLRKRNDWMNWLRPPPIQSTSTAGQQLSSASDHDMLANRIQNVGLDGGNTSNGSMTGPADTHLNKVPSRSSTQSSDGEGGAHYSS